MIDVHDDNNARMTEYVNVRNCRFEFHHSCICHFGRKNSAYKVDSLAISNSQCLVCESKQVQ